MRKLALSAILVFVYLFSFSQSTLGFELVVEGLSFPVGIEEMGDERLFVIEKGGRVRIIDQGALSNEPFIDIDDRVDAGASEQGLLGMAFHPNFPDTPHVYFNYTKAYGNTRISRFSLSANPNQLDPGSEKILMTISQPFGNHNGGDLNFGPDGYLYIGMGDGGSGGDPEGNGQNTNTFLGKMLRIDIDKGDPYAIPSTNPFVNDNSILDEIWALGLRNPWRFSFDRLTNEMYIADVGQNQLEEISYEPANSIGGYNFGWRCYEGNLPFNTNNCDDPNVYTAPIYEYGHDLGCSITGGHVYRGSEFPELFGKYIYTDYCSGLIWALYQDDTGQWVNDSLGNFENNSLASFGEDANGEMYVTSRRSGAIFKLVTTCNSGIPIIDAPVNIEVCENDPLSLDAGPIPDGFSYQWYKDSIALVGQMDRFYQPTSNGTYAVIFNGPCSSDFSNQVEVAIIDVPTINPLIDLGDLISADSGFLSYRWLLDGVEIQLSSSNVVSADSAGWYVVEVTTAEGCEILSDSLFHQVSNVVNLDFIDQFKCFPNPTSDLLQVKIAMHNAGTYEVSLSDVNGQQIENSRRPFNLLLDEVYQLNKLPSGQYFISITQQGKVISTKKIFKK